jgi:hypothetical protein
MLRFVAVPIYHTFVNYSTEPIAYFRLCVKEPVLAQFNTLSKANVQNNFIYNTPIYN